MKVLLFAKQAASGGITPASIAGGTLPKDSVNTANRVSFQAQTAAVRWTDDGSAPSATNGFILNTTDPPVIYERAAISNLRFTEAVAANGAIVAMSFYR